MQRQQIKPRVRDLSRILAGLIDLAENLCDLCSSGRARHLRTIDGEATRCCNDCAAYVDKAQERRRAG